MEYQEYLRNQFPWLSKKVPTGYWESVENQRLFIDWLGKELGYKKPEDWYKVKHADFKKNGGSGLLASYYKGSHFLALKTLMPEYDWIRWLFKKVPKGYWDSVENRRLFIDWLGKELGYKKPEDWYKIKADDFTKNNGYGLLNKYENSPIQTVQSLLPEYNLETYHFRNLPLNYWKSIENRKGFMNRLALKIGIKKPEDWYKVTQKDFNNNGGGTLLVHYYEGSHFLAITTLMPEYDWIPWLFNQVPIGYWESVENHRLFIDWLGKELGYKKPEDWYKVTQKDFNNNGGGGLLFHYYKSSPSLSITTLMPEYDWKLWLFGHTPSDFWEKPENQRKYIIWLGEILGYEEPEDWYKVTQKDFNNNSGGGLLVGYYEHSPALAVLKIFPEYELNHEKFSIGLKRQKSVLNIVKKLYGKSKVEWNYKHPELIFKKSKKRMELDIFVPSQNLAIEYQGEQHFFPMIFVDEKGFKELQERDEEKRNACKRIGIKLIEVPYTWNGRKDSLVKLINTAKVNKQILEQAR